MPVLDPGVAVRMVRAHREGQWAAQPARKFLASLSDREREVVGLIGQGLRTRRWVGSSVCPGPPSRVSAVPKIVRRNRMQAALLAYRGGLLDEL